MRGWVRSWILSKEAYPMDTPSQDDTSSSHFCSTISLNMITIYLGIALQSMCPSCNPEKACVFIFDLAGKNVQTIKQFRREIDMKYLKSMSPI